MTINQLAIFIVATISLSACTLSATRTQDSNSANSMAETAVQKTPTPTTTPLPFQKMTIPYLRTQNYQSSLGAQQQYQTNSQYTSFLTSYTSEGLRVNALLTIPKAEQPPEGWPAIVFVHGYIPPTLYRTTERYIDHINALARSGFVVFKIDLRGHGSSEGTAGGGYFSSDYVVDTIHAIRALQSTDFVHPQKIGLWGHSMAGNVLLRTFAVEPETPAVVIWGGAGFTYTDLQQYRIQDNSWRPPASNTPSQQQRQELFATHGQFSRDTKFWRQVSPEDYLSDLKGALQLHHAQDDTVVNIEYSRNLNKLLDDTTIPHKLYEYPSGGHNISGGSFSTAMQRTIAFYDQYLK